MSRYNVGYCILVFASWHYTFTKVLTYNPIRSYYLFIYINVHRVYIINSAIDIFLSLLLSTLVFIVQSIYVYCIIILSSEKSRVLYFVKYFFLEHSFSLFAIFKHMIQIPRKRIQFFSNYYYRINARYTRIYIYI